MIFAGGTMIVSDKIAIIVIGIIGAALSISLIWHEILVHKVKKRKDE